MPYSTISQLPEGVKDALPEAAQRIFMRAFDASFEKYGEESAMKIAWAAVKNAGYHKKDGEWVKTDEEVHTNRYDSTSFSTKPVKTPQGFLKVSANVSRTGVFKYYNADGSVRRELRLPEEVFNEKALSTLSSAPITFGHPSESGRNVLVNPKNAKKFSVGMLGEQIHTDDKFIAASLIITDEDVIDAVEKGHRREVSLGYSCDLEMSSGTWNGESYDAIQRNIVYNHAAIVSKGRAGSEVAIRMDSDDAMTEYPETIYPENNEVKKMDTKLIRVDGADFELPATTAQAIEQSFTKRDAEFAALKADFENTKGQLDAVKEELVKAQQARTDAEDPARLHAAIAERVALVAKAQKVIGSEEDLTTLSDRQIKEKAISQSNPDMKFDSLSDDYINGRFDMVVEAHIATQESLNNAKVAVSAAAKSEVKSAETVRAAHLKFLNKGAN
jgi:cation transport regulator ChaB